MKMDQSNRKLFKKLNKAFVSTCSYNYKYKEKK